MEVLGVRRLFALLNHYCNRLTGCAAFESLPLPPSKRHVVLCSLERGHPSKRNGVAGSQRPCHNAKYLAGSEVHAGRYPETPLVERDERTTFSLVL